MALKGLSSGKKKSLLEYVQMCRQSGWKISDRIASSPKTAVVQKIVVQISPISMGLICAMAATSIFDLESESRVDLGGISIHLNGCKYLMVIIVRSLNDPVQNWMQQARYVAPGAPSGAP